MMSLACGHDVKQQYEKMLNLKNFNPEVLAAGIKKCLFIRLLHS